VQSVAISCNQRPLPAMIGVLIRGHRRCNQLQSARRPLPGRIGQRPSVRPRAHPRPSDALVGHLRQAVPLRPRRHSARERETDRESSLRETGRKRGREGEGGRGREQTSRSGDQPRDQPKRRSSDDHQTLSDQTLSDAIGRNHRREIIRDQAEIKPRSRLRLGLLLRPRLRQPLRFQRGR
jgi:hypothetical protein